MNDIFAVLDDIVTVLDHEYDPYSGVHTYYCEIHGKCYGIGNSLEGVGYWMAPLIDGELDWDKTVEADTISALVDSVM